MHLISETILYIIYFFAIYIQIFILITFLESKKKVIIKNDSQNNSRGLLEFPNVTPNVTIVVPCFNEEKTICNTINSLLDLNYPKDKLKIFIVNDGSTDKTEEEINKFLPNEQIKYFSKQNGGKHTALNLGLENTDTEFVGCLDADASVDTGALNNVIECFKKNPSYMAVVPCISLKNSKNIIESAQKTNYNVRFFLFQHAFLFLNMIFITDGPFSIFRKKVFDDLGPYKAAHKTEDMEIALRMQKNHYKIGYCGNAYVYTNPKPTMKTFYKQRLRWCYGLINNIIDYNSILFKKEYGNLGFFALPAVIITYTSIVYLSFRVLYYAFDFIYLKLLQFQMVGDIKLFNSLNSFDPFFISHISMLFMYLIIVVLVVYGIILSRKESNLAIKSSCEILPFLVIFSFITPFWIINAIINTITSKEPSWR